MFTDVACPGRCVDGASGAPEEWFALVLEAGMALR